jgi:hypothetical protein
MNDAKVFGILDDCDIIRVQFSIGENRTMDLIPVLNSFSYLGMFYFKLPTGFMELCKESSPSKNDGLVFHPSELGKDEA